MIKVKSLAAAVALTFVLAVGAGAQAPPSCAPGETLTPPCMAPVTSDDSVAPGETLTPPASESVDSGWLVEVALNALMLF